jgi:hypothetical protein
MPDCLSTLIGIAANDCECFAGIDEDYTVSDSGFYLTDPLNGVPNLNAILASAPSCTSGDGGVWDILNAALQSGIRDLRGDLTASLSLHRQMAGAWRGNAAKTLEPTGTVNAANGKNGLQITSERRLIDMAFVVTDLYVGSNLTGTTPVKFSANLPSDEFTQADVSCNTVAGTFAKNHLATEIRLPLYSPSEERIFYNLYWEPGIGERPLVGKIWCCGGPGGWSKFVDIGGFNLATIDPYTKYSGSAAYGLLIGGYISCNELDFVCNLDQLNGEYNWKHLLGRTLLFKSAIHAIAGMLGSDSVNRYTLINAETAGKRMKDLTDAYNTNIEYIAKSLPTGFSACWGCNKSDFTISKNRI